MQMGALDAHPVCKIITKQVSIITAWAASWMVLIRMRRGPEEGTREKDTLPQ
jgi:hypothetical protein